MTYKVKINNIDMDNMTAEVDIRSKDQYDEEIEADIQKTLLESQYPSLFPTWKDTLKQLFSWEFVYWLVMVALITGGFGMLCFFHRYKELIWK